MVRLQLDRPSENGPPPLATRANSAECTSSGADLGGIPLFVLIFEYFLAFLWAGIWRPQAAKGRGNLIHLKAAYFALALVCLGAGQGHSEGTSFRDWALACDSERECRLAQTLMSSERIWIATIMLHPRDVKAESRVAEVLVPPGVHFPSGLFVTAADDQHRRAEWVRCTSAACESLVRLDATAETQWKAGAAAELRFRPSPAAPVASVDISLMGVTAGLAALDARAGEATR